MNLMPIGGEPNQVYDEGNKHAGGIGDDHTDHKRLHGSIEGHAAHSENNHLHQPHEKKVGDGHVYAVGSHDAESNRMERPPGESVVNNE